MPFKPVLLHSAFRCGVAGRVVCAVERARVCVSLHALFVIFGALSNGVLLCDGGALLVAGSLS